MDSKDTQSSPFPSHGELFRLAFYDVTVFSSVDGVQYADSVIVCAETSIEAIHRVISSPRYKQHPVQGSLCVMVGNPLISFVD